MIWEAESHALRDLVLALCHRRWQASLGNYAQPRGPRTTDQTIPARETDQPDVALIQARNLAYAVATKSRARTFRAVPSQRMSPLGAAGRR